MPSGTPRTHGGHGRPPPLVPGIGPRVLRAMPASRRIPDLTRPAPADAADPDTVRAHLHTAGHQPPEPARASARIRQRSTTASRRARRAGPRRNAAPTGRPEPEDRRAAAGTARKAPERSEPAIRPLLLRSRRHTRRGEQRPVCAGRAVGYPGLTAARLLVSSGSAGRGGHECLDHGCESGWVVTSEARMPSGSATSSSPTGGGHCSALYAHADERALSL